jgi:DNA polymerase III subunit epsilon
MQLKLTRPLAIFDLETTGTNIATDRIVEIAILKVHSDGHEETRVHLVNPEMPIPPEVTAIHGITDEDVKDKPTFRELAGNLLSFIGNSDLAGYNNIKFDIPLLAEEFLRTDQDLDLKNRRVIDVQNIFHKMEQRTLKAAYRFYCGKELINAHSAEADTRATYDVLLSQLDRYENAEYTDRSGVVSKPVVNDIKALHDFSYYNRNADLAGNIIYNDKNEEVFNFGKYKNHKVEDIFKKEPSYYDWMMKSAFPLTTKKVITAIKLRGFGNGGKA